MADQIIHLTRTETVKPTVFEITAEQSLHNLLYQSIKQLIGEKVIYFNELYLVFDSILQFYYLKFKDASFSESFYGLKRFRFYDNQLSSLSRSDRLKSIAFLTIVPYLKRKLDYINSDDSGKPLYKVYKIFRILERTVSLLLFIRYLTSNRIVAATIPLYLSSFQLHYSKIAPNSSTIFQKVVSFFEIAVFLLQFWDLWKTSDAFKATSTFPKLKPPQRHFLSQRFKNKCPICSQVWKIPTIVSTSGYVYCFGCIMEHFKKSKTCPVTGYPTDINRLVRIIC